MKFLYKKNKGVVIVEFIFYAPLLALMMTFIWYMLSRLELKQNLVIEARNQAVLVQKNSSSIEKEDSLKRSIMGTAPNKTLVSHDVAANTKLTICSKDQSCPPDGNTKETLKLYVENNSSKGNLSWRRLEAPMRSQFPQSFVREKSGVMFFVDTAESIGGKVGNVFAEYIQGLKIFGNNQFLVPDEAQQVLTSAKVSANVSIFDQNVATLFSYFSGKSVEDSKKELGLQIVQNTYVRFDDGIFPKSYNLAAITGGAIGYTFKNYKHWGLMDGAHENIKGELKDGFLGHCMMKFFVGDDCMHASWHQHILRIIVLIKTITNIIDTAFTFGASEAARVAAGTAMEKIQNQLISVATQEIEKQLENIPELQEFMEENGDLSKVIEKKLLEKAATAGASSMSEALNNVNVIDQHSQDIEFLKP